DNWRPVTLLTNEIPLLWILSELEVDSNIGSSRCAHQEPPKLAHPYPHPHHVPSLELVPQVAQQQASARDDVTGEAACTSIAANTGSSFARDANVCGTLSKLR